MKSFRNWISLICVLALCFGLFTACKNSKEIMLSCRNGAQVQAVLTDVTGSAVSKTDIGISVEVSDGSVGVNLMTAYEAESLRVLQGMSPSFAELSTSLGDGFSFVNASSYVHVFPMDANTYVCLSSESESALFDLEGRIAFTPVVSGETEADEFSSHFGS